MTKPDSEKLRGPVPDEQIEELMKSIKSPCGCAVCAMPLALRQSATLRLS
jgi:hypothetical protein